MQFINPGEATEYTHELYAEIRNLCESFRYRMRNVINDYENLSDDIEALVLELATHLEDTDAAGRVEDQPATPEPPY